MKSTFPLLLVLLFVFCSCNQNRKSKDSIPDDRFINFYTDYLIVKEENTILSFDSLAATKRIDSIYNLHNLTKQQIEHARTEYNKDLARWQSIYEKVLENI
ncbi:MAG: hypothetical protein EPO24_03425, partial [Bacteroidetes bacterium]